MATKLTKPVTRVVELTAHGPVVVTLYPSGYMGFRFPRKRGEHQTDMSKVLTRVLMQEAEATYQQRRTRRKAS